MAGPPSGLMAGPPSGLMAGAGPPSGLMAGPPLMAVVVARVTAIRGQTARREGGRMRSLVSPLRLRVSGKGGEGEEHCVGWRTQHISGEGGGVPSQLTQDKTQVSHCLCSSTCLATADVWHLGNSGTQSERSSFSRCCRCAPRGGATGALPPFPPPCPQTPSWRRLSGP